ncbi:hypothetical protein M1D80_11810 [Phyllobacteriaceae bacterium JZ32]
MIARPGPRTSSCNAGQLSADLAGRPDIKQYYSGGLRFRGIEPVPQSGFRLLPGSRDAGPVRRSLGVITHTGVSINLGPHSAPATIYQKDINGVVSGVEVENLSGTASFTFVVEIFNAGTWQPIGPAMAAGTSPVSRFVAFPPGLGKVATAFRIRVSPVVSTTFAISSAVAYQEQGTPVIPRYRGLKQDQTNGFFFAFGAGFVDIWKNKSWVACVRLPQLTQAMLPDLDFYAEASTVGIFHTDLQTLRIRRAGSDFEWTLDLWPYDGIPDVDYGGIYPKVDDIWEIFIRWTGGDVFIYLTITVDGETAEAVPVTDASGTPVAASSLSADWDLFAANVAGALNGLPSSAGDITVTQVLIDAGGDSQSRKLTVTFGGASSGVEYQVSCLIANTADAAALPTHTQIGKTDGEPLLSASRGWPGTAALMQDRLGYARIKGQPAAQLLSRVGEYFTVNTEAGGDAAPRLDRLRTETSETIYRIKESKYFLAFTDLGAYFATNRTISANEPLNYVLASEIGIRVNTDPIDLEGLLYYISNNGQQILSLEYDDVSTSYNANPESLLTDLVQQIVRNARQVGSVDTDTNRMWLMRADGRLVSANVIRNQDILGTVEWGCADGGRVREIAIDGYNSLWVCIERDGTLRHEYLEENLLFQGAMTTTTDLAGVVSGLHFPNGTAVWCEADGFVLGPFTVLGGAIDLGNPFNSVTVGRWIAPVYESMPHVLVTDDDRILRRPGRIHTAYIDIIDTTSIAVGANNGTPRDVALLETGDPVDQPLRKKTKMITVSGMLGMVVDTTLVITQVRPGYLRVRNFSTGERL